MSSRWLRIPPVSKFWPLADTNSNSSRARQIRTSSRLWIRRISLRFRRSIETDASFWLARGRRRNERRRQFTKLSFIRKRITIKVSGETLRRHTKHIFLCWGKEELWPMQGPNFSKKILRLMDTSCYRMQQSVASVENKENSCLGNVTVHRIEY